MATKVTCDICGSALKPTAALYLQVNTCKSLTTLGRTIKTMDLCRGCYKDLCSMLKADEAK